MTGDLLGGFMYCHHFATRDQRSYTGRIRVWSLVVSQNPVPSGMVIQIIANSEREHVAGPGRRDWPAGTVPSPRIARYSCRKSCL